MVKAIDQASLVDIVPTILQTIDAEFPQQSIGKVLLNDKEPLSWLKQVFFRTSEARYIFSELDKNFTLKSIITPAWK